MLKYLFLACFCYLFVNGEEVPDALQFAELSKNNPALQFWNILKNTKSIHKETGLSSRDEPPPNIGACNSSPCQNGGICIPIGFINYACTCLPILDGKNCEYVKCFQIPWPTGWDLPQPFWETCDQTATTCGLFLENPPAKCVCFDSNTPCGLPSAEKKKKLIA